MTSSPRRSRTSRSRMPAAVFGVACAAAAVIGVARGVDDGTGAGSPNTPVTAGVQAPAPASTAHLPTARATDEALPSPTWSDEFTGPAGAAPDPKNWQPVTGGYGFGNGELECNTDDRRNSSLDGDGHLIITARAEQGFQCVDGHRNDYFSARLSTGGLHAQAYGKMRVRAELPTSPGLWPAIWALGADNPVVGWPMSGEIDLAEVVGDRPSTVFQTIHGPATDGGAYQLDHATDLGQSADATFHVYGLDWTPDSITFSIDGHPTGTLTRAQVEQRGQWVFDKPFYLLLDVAVGGSFPGPPTAQTQLPRSMVVDYVRVYA